MDGSIYTDVRNVAHSNNKKNNKVIIIYKQMVCAFICWPQIHMFIRSRQTGRLIHKTETRKQ